MTGNSAANPVDSGYECGPKWVIDKNESQYIEARNRKMVLTGKTEEKLLLCALSSCRVAHHTLHGGVFYK